MPNFSPSTIKLCSVHRLRRKKKSKIAAVPTHVPLEALYLVVDGLIVSPKENAFSTAAILDFLSCPHYYKGVKQFQKGVTAGNDPL